MMYLPIHIKEIYMELFNWSDSISPPARREKARVKEVSPCSEYTRYTVEGVMKDPWSDLSARFHAETLGTLLSNSSFNGPRWSDKLGYGIAVIGEDTRVHIHQNGKFIIRRALDREHAQRSYGSIRILYHPALMEDGTDRPLWFLIKLFLLGDRIEGENFKKMLLWPENEGNVEEIMASVNHGMGEMREKLGETLGENGLLLALKGDRVSLDDHVEFIKGAMVHEHRKSQEDPWKTLGSLTALVCALKAASELSSIIDLMDGNEEEKDKVISWMKASYDPKTQPTANMEIASDELTLCLERYRFLTYVQPL